MGIALLKNTVEKDIELIEFETEHQEILNKYSNVQPVYNNETGNYYFKYTVYDIENLISELSTLGLSKEMAILNIKKYGYETELEYILNALGFEYKTKNKVKVSKSIRKQSELFDFLFNINRECYIRLRNKNTGQYRAYSIETLKDPYRLQAILKSNYFSNNTDMMYSLNCYNNMYKTTEDSLFSLQNIAIDVDFDTNEYTVTSALKEIKKEMGNNVPVATIIETGHRIRLLYTIQDVPATKKSIKVYNLVTNEIAKRLKQYGASAQAPTTFGRIEGSVNSKNGAEVSNILFNPTVYTLRQLQKELLPTWEKVIQKANKNGKVVKLRNTYTLNLDRLRDFEMIQTIREEDCRELLCYLYRNYCLLSNMTHEEAWEKTKRFNSNFRNPLKENELDSDTKCLNRKQYLHKSVTILHMFDITHEEEEQLHLINIMSKYEYNRRDKLYQKNRYQEKLKVEGKKTKAEQLQEVREKIKALRQQGLKNKEIMQRLGISSTTTFERHIKYLKEKGLL